MLHYVCKLPISIASLKTWNFQQNSISNWVHSIRIPEDIMLAWQLSESKYMQQNYKIIVFSRMRLNSRGVTVPPLCPTPFWQGHVISKKNSYFYLISCLDLEIHPPKLALGTISDSGWWHLTRDILVFCGWYLMKNYFKP